MGGLKENIKKDAKHFTESQLYVISMDLLKSKVLNNINKNMSRDYKIEFGYDFVSRIKKFIKCLNKLFNDKKHNFKNKDNYFDEIEDSICEVDIILEMLLTLKKTDKDNWVGMTSKQLLDVKKDWGYIISCYRNYREWISKNTN